MANRSSSVLNIRKAQPKAIVNTRNYRPVSSPSVNKKTQVPNVPEVKKKKIKKEKPKKGPKSEGDWEYLPDIILEAIFAQLSLRDRHLASQVCRNWNRIFYSQHVWGTFTLEDVTLTRRRYNYHLGYQYVLDHYRAQVCFQRIGRNIRKLIIKPMENFFNLYEFLTIATFYSEYFEDDPLQLLHYFDFTFACDCVANHSRQDEESVFGTGGKLLEALKRFMSNLEGLRHLSLQDLLLDKAEAMYLLDDVAYNCCETLKTLRIINCTKDPYPLFPVGVFVNLRRLTISPQHLNEEVVKLIGYTNLKELYLLQTRQMDVSPVPGKAWRECRKAAPFLSVHLKIEGALRTEIVWQEEAPVRSILYECPYSTVSFSSILACTSLYAKDLQTYAHLGLPRFYMSRKFQERPDSSLMLMSRTCRNLHTIVIRELISTATVVLLAQECKHLRTLAVRRNALLKKFDWPHNPCWTDHFYDWLKSTSLSYELTTQEVSKALGFKWKPLSDREFKLLRL